MDPNRKSTRKAIDADRRAVTAVARLPRPPKGWIATVRYALGVSQEILGGRLRAPKQRISQLEARERDNTIRLDQLRSVAEALGCDLVYAFVPREPLEESVKRQARDVALRELKAVERSMQLEGQETPITEERLRDYIARHVDETELWQR